MSAARVTILALLVCWAFAAAADVALGTVEGEKQFTVRGVMKSSGLTSAFGGNLAVMDIYAAQHMFGRGRSFDRIDLQSDIGGGQPVLYLDDVSLVPGGTPPANLQIFAVSTAVDKNAGNYPPAAWLAKVAWSKPVLADDEKGTAAQACAAAPSRLRSCSFSTTRRWGSIPSFAATFSNEGRSGHR
jgi:hypothetical protein